MNFPNLQSPRLVLSQLTKRDAHSIFKLFTNSDVIKYYDLEAFTDLSQAVDYIEFMQQRFETKSGIRWGIRIKESNELIGTCGFNSWKIKMKSAIIGYDILPVYWRKGLGTEAVNVIVNEAFLGSLPCGNLNRIQADTIPGNLGSEYLLLKIGFKEEGLRRQCGFWKDRFHDLKCFGLVKDEYMIQG